MVAVKGVMVAVKGRDGRDGRGEGRDNREGRDGRERSLLLSFAWGMDRCWAQFWHFDVTSLQKFTCFLGINKTEAAAADVIGSKGRVVGGLLQIWKCFGVSWKIIQMPFLLWSRFEAS